MREPKCPIANMRCPRNSDPERGAYCPAWTEYSETNAQTGEERIQKECMFTAMPKFMIHTLRAANRPAAAVEETRNEIAKGFSQVAGHLSRVQSSMNQISHEEDRDET